MNLRRCEMGDTRYQLDRTTDGRSDRRLVSYPGVRDPGVAVYDSGAVLFIPLPAAFVFEDKTRRNAAEEINSIAAQGSASSAWENSAFASGQCAFPRSAAETDIGKKGKDR